MPTLYPGVALVTGAASGTLTLSLSSSLNVHQLNINEQLILSLPGIGRQVALSFAAEGCTRIVIADRDEDGLAETKKLMEASASESELQVKIQRVNVLDEAEVDDMVESAVDLYGRVDYAVNCAGLFTPSPPLVGSMVADDGTE